MNLNSVHTYLCVMLSAVILTSVNVSARMPLICYFEGWSIYRQTVQKSDITKLPVDICTHIIYAFAGLDEGQNVIKVLDSWGDLEIDQKGGFKKLVELKGRNPSLKVSLAIGGWSEGSTKYSKMASLQSTRTSFANSIATLLNTYGFDGVDLDWEYPTERGGSGDDRTNFQLLLKDMRAAIGDKLLTVAVSANPTKIPNDYDVAEVSRTVDFIHVMTYDMRGSWDKYVDNHVLLYARSDQSYEAQQLTVANGMKAWLNAGAPKQKLIMGFGFYGRSFTLTDPNNNRINAPHNEFGGEAGEVSAAPGVLHYYEICERIKNRGWTEYWDDTERAPYATKGNQWVGYDNERSIREKVNHLKSMGYGGAMVWAIDTDDAAGSVCTGRSYPLGTALRDALGNDGGSSGGDPPQPPAPTNTPIRPPTAGPGPGPGPSPDKPRCENVGDYLPHEKYCYKFYQCGADKQPVEKECAGGLYFSKSISTCNWKAQAWDAQPAGCPSG